MRCLNSVTVSKNVKGDPLRFLDIHCVAKYGLQNIVSHRNKRRWNPKNFKKSRIVPNKIRVKNTKGGSYVFEVLDVDAFVLGEVLAFRVFWTSVVLVDHVEQVNKKSGPIALN